MYQYEASSMQADLFDPPATADPFGSRARAHQVAGRLVAIIDDDDGARLSTAWLLEGEGYRVLPFASGDAFLDRRLPEPPACLLLDLRMPGRNGLDVLRALGARDDAPPVLVLTGHADLSMAVAAMKLKAIDVILKPYQPHRLLEAIEAASAQREEADAARAARNRACQLIDGLSERQRQVLAGVVRGRANKLIAWELGLSIRTVETYRAQMLERLGVHGTAEAVRVAIAAGMATTAQPSDCLAG